MRKTIAAIIFLFACAYAANSDCQQTAKNERASRMTKLKVIDMDADLEGYPDYYKNRVMEFRKIIRQQKMQKDKIKKAMAILSGNDPKYKKDAIEFLIEVRAKEAVPSLIKAGEYKDLRPDVAFALGEIRDASSIEFLLKCLYDDNQNVRGNAVLSLRKLTKMQFGYDYSDPEERRKKAALLWESWWARNSNRFRIDEPTQEETKEAQEKWEKYGKRFIERESGE